MTDAPDLSPTAASHAQDTRPRSLARWTMRIVGGLLALVLIAYLVALGALRWQARQVLRQYDQLLTVRLGDSVDDFRRKTPNCPVSSADGAYNCIVQPTIYHDNNLLWHWLVWHETDRKIRLISDIQRAGLRWWMLQYYVTVHQGRIESLEVMVFVIGQDDMRGIVWLLVRPDSDLAPRDGRHTSASRTHITSFWNGRGCSMRFTPASPNELLQMRKINGDCLTSFKGCATPVDFTPSLPPPGRESMW